MLCLTLCLRRVKTKIRFPFDKLTSIGFSFFLIGLLGISSGCQATPLQKQKEQAAEEKLEQLLGENQSKDGDLAPLSPPAEQTQPTPDESPLGGLPGWAQKMMPGQPEINVEETNGFYRIVISLDNPNDANSVKLNVLPHQIQISGQSSFGKEGLQGSSSFFKSFNTQSELAPERLKREDFKPSAGDGKLVFVIPKKTPGKAQKNTPEPDSSTLKPLTPKHLPKSLEGLPNNLPPDVLEQLDNTQGQAI